ncbi:MAG: arginase family protein [Alphaproteobacteria bacterium]|nr:MAG: arginase family protein [Alphaproteobacteria bacterium]
MIFINPQWQGSGLTDEIRIGAETLKQYYKDTNEVIEVPLSEKELSMVDNIKCFHPIIEQTIFVKKLISDIRPTKISTIGGDCGVEIIPISYLNEIYKKDIYIIWIDAHADLNTPETSPSKTFHGMVLRTLLGDGNRQIKDLLFSTITPEQICFMGIQDLDEPERKYISSKRIVSLSNCNISEIQALRKDFSKIYIHLDLDVLDKKEFKFTMCPTRYGFKISDVTQLLKDLKENYNIIGICITESTASNLKQLIPLKPILDQIEL